MSGEKRQRKKQYIWYYVRQKTLMEEMEMYHATVSIRQTLLCYMVYLGLCLALGLYLHLKPISMLFVAGMGIFCIPRLLVHTCKNVYEQRRFSDIAQYMQQLLYSFRGNGKIKTSLEDVRQLFDVDNPLVKSIDRALAILEAPIEGKGTPRRALNEIEKDFHCEKLRTIHEFLIRVEETGGEYDKTLLLLLEDRSHWVERISLAQAVKKKQKRNVTLSILVTIGMSGLLSGLMPSQVDITEHWIYQIVTVGMLILDEVIYVSTNRKLAINWLKQVETMSARVIQRRYAYLLHYDRKKEQKKSCLYAGGTLFLALLSAVMEQKLLCGLELVLSGFLLFQHRMNYSLSMRGVKREIRLKFPRWLMDLALLLQSTNVQVAIFQSIRTAPLVLVPALDDMRTQLEEDPISVQPYLAFLKEFHIPEIQATMKMLYALSQGAGGDPQEQIAEIITRNNKMLDKAEEEADENQLAAMYIDFLLPQLTAGAVVLADMVLYILLYLPQMSKW